MTAGKTKRIFISDIHMGDARSAAIMPPNTHRYGWFLNKKGKNQNRPQMLSDFLQNHVIADTTIDELVILGDLFDEWVCPADMEPIEPGYTNQLEAIAKADQNTLVFTQLKALAKDNRLVYVAGNHDMLGTKEPARDFITGYLKGVRYFGKDCLGTYKTDDGIIAQHGHQYCLFNAPWTKTSGTGGFEATMLPMGFDLARLDAQVVGRKGHHYGFLDFLKDALLHELKKAGLELALASVTAEHEAHSEGIGEVIDKLIIDLFKTFRSDEVFKGQAGVIYGDLDDVPGTISWEAIETRYGAIFSQWAATHTDNVSALKALINELGYLESGAYHVLESQDSPIVLFGHTHIADFKLYRPDMSEHPAGHQIYANSGTWINEKKCHFIKTELSGKIHKVSVWEYSDNKPKPLPDKSGLVQI